MYLIDGVNKTIFEIYLYFFSDYFTEAQYFKLNTKRIMNTIHYQREKIKVMKKLHINFSY